MWSSVEGGTEYELVIGPLTTLTGRMENYGTKVSLQLQPKHRQSYMVYQNVHAQIGRDSYEYSEAWTLNSSKSQHDVFSVPPGTLRARMYECHADTVFDGGGGACTRTYHAMSVAGATPVHPPRLSECTGPMCYIVLHFLALH
jgi:hypothetical protein